MSYQDELIGRLRLANPVPAAALRGAVREDRARRDLERILEEEPPRRRPPRRRLPAVAAVAAALAAVVIAVVVVVPEREVPRPDADAVLVAAARVAERTETLVPGPGQFVYVRTQLITRATVGDEDAYTVLIPRVREVWAAPDGSGRIRDVPEDLIFPGPRDERRWRAAGSPSFGGRVTDRTVEAGALLPPEVANLPPAELEEVLARLSDGPRPVQAFDAAAELLAQPLVDGPTRARLFRFLAGLEGVEALGEVEDPLGRIGQGVGFSHRGYGPLTRHVLIFDPETSRVLADEEIMLEPLIGADAEPPFTVGSRVQLEVGVTSSVEERP